MKASSKRLLALAAVAVLVGGIGFYYRWQARIEGKVDLSRKLIGRWVTEGESDIPMSGAPLQVAGDVTWAKGRAGRARSKKTTQRGTARHTR